MKENHKTPAINWLIENRLGGCARPDSDAALLCLQAANTGLLITLTAEWQPNTKLLASKNISSQIFPIQDLTPPSRSQAVEICQSIDTALGQNLVTILHCAAGKGRTGTLLTSYLVWQGRSPEAAITKARSLYPEWIETTSQIEFLKGFRR